MSDVVTATQARAIEAHMAAHAALRDSRLPIEVLLDLYSTAAQEARTVTHLAHDDDVLYETWHTRWHRLDNVCDALAALVLEQDTPVTYSVHEGGPRILDTHGNAAGSCAEHTTLKGTD